jgi:O-antigen ligase
MQAVGVAIMGSVILVSRRAGGAVFGAAIALYLVLDNGILGFSVPRGAREVLLFCWIVGVIWRGRGRTLVAPPPALWGIAFAWWGLALLVFHGVNDVSLQSYILNLEFVLAFVVAVVYRDSESPLWVLYGFCAGAGLAIVAGLMGYSYARTDAVGNVLSTRLYDAKIAGLSIDRRTWGFGEANNAGLALAMLVGVLAALRPKRALGKVVVSLGLVGGFAALLLTFSRTAFLVVVTQWLVYVVVLRLRPDQGSRMGRWHVSVALALGLVLVVLAVPVLSSRLMSIFDSSHPANEARLGIATVLLQGIEEAPVVGHGWDSIGVFTMHLKQRSFAVGDDHYLQYAFQLGVPGLLVLIGLLLSVFRRALRATKAGDAAVDRRALAALGIAFALGGLTLTVWEMLPAAGMFWMVCASSLPGQSQQQPPHQERLS